MGPFGALSRSPMPEPQQAIPQAPESNPVGKQMSTGQRRVGQALGNTLAVVAVAVLAWVLLRNLV